MNVDPVIAAAAALGAFAVLSFFDGIVLHFFVERLPLRPSSRLEHLLHTARAVLFPMILVAYFGGWGPIALGFTLLAIDQMIEVWDMAIERRSRVHTVGLPSREYMLHGALTTLRAAAVVFAMMIERGADETRALDGLVSMLVPGAIIAAVAHVVLATDGGRTLLARTRSVA